MNSQIVLVATVFLAAATLVTLVVGANVPNANAPPVLLTAVGPQNPGDPNNPAPQQGPGQPGALVDPSKGNSDDQDTASTFGFWGGWGGWGYPYYGGWGGYRYRPYGGYYGGYYRPYGYGGWGWGW